MSEDQDAFAQGMQEGMARKCGVSERKTEEAKCIEEAMLSLMRVRMERDEANERILKLETEKSQLVGALNKIFDISKLPAIRLTAREALKAVGEEV